MDYSEDIGYLRAKAENTESQINTLFKKNDRQTELMGEIHAMLKLHVSKSNERHDDIEKDIFRLSDDVSFCKKASEDYYSIKKIAIAFAGFAAFVWTFIWKFVEKALF